MERRDLWEQDEWEEDRGHNGETAYNNPFVKRTDLLTFIINNEQDHVRLW